MRNTYRVWLVAHGKSIVAQYPPERGSDNRGPKTPQETTHNNDALFGGVAKPWDGLLPAKSDARPPETTRKTTAPRMGVCLHILTCVMAAPVPLQSSGALARTFDLQKQPNRASTSHQKLRDTSVFENNGGRQTGYMSYHYP